MRRCSSSNNVNPPGPGRHVSSPVLARPFGSDALGSNFTLRDHSPSRALVSPTISADGCGAEVSDCAFAQAMVIPQTLRRQSESEAVLKLFFMFGSLAHNEVWFEKIVIAQFAGSIATLDASSRPCSRQDAARVVCDYRSKPNREKRR